MIIRVLTAQIDSANVAEANTLLRQLLDEIRQQPGLAYAKLARRLVENDDEDIILIEEWLTPVDLFTWTGGMLQRARLPASAPDIFGNVSITHYESLDRLPGDLERNVIVDPVPEADLA
jgi:hypothetical protein